MNTFNEKSVIENYLSGMASDAEKRWLIQEMQQNPSLKREFDLRRRTNEILSDRSVLDLRHKLDAIEMKKRGTGVFRRTAVRLTRYAAAVACLAIVSSALYFPLKSTSPEKLYSKYYTHYTAPGVTRSVNANNNYLLVSAMESYNARDFKSAIVYLEKMLSMDSGNMELVFMHGISNMEVHNYPEARGSFAEVINQNDNLYLEDAAWYLGLCYMMDNEKEKAVKQFEFIATTESRHKKAAAKLARKLR